MLRRFVYFFFLWKLHSFQGTRPLAVVKTIYILIYQMHGYYLFIYFSLLSTNVKEKVTICINVCTGRGVEERDQQPHEQNGG